MESAHRAYQIQTHGCGTGNEYHFYCKLRQLHSDQRKSFCSYQWSCDGFGNVRHHHIFQTIFLRIINGFLPSVPFDFIQSIVTADNFHTQSFCEFAELCKIHSKYFAIAIAECLQFFVTETCYLLKYALWIFTNSFAQCIQLQSYGFRLFSGSQERGQ